MNTTHGPSNAIVETTRKFLRVVANFWHESMKSWRRVLHNGLQTPGEQLLIVRNGFRKSWKVIALVILFFVADYWGRGYPWGKWPPHGTGKRRIWLIEPSKDANHQVLTVLLQQNREEVRAWQEHLFHISLAFILAVLGIVSFALKMKVIDDWLRLAFTVAVVFLCAFYLTFVKVAEEAIALNHRDLTGIEIGLKLAKEGEYIKDQAIYDHSYETQLHKMNGEQFIKTMVPYLVFLGFLAAAALLFLPIPSQPPEQPKEPQTAGA